MVVAVVVVTRMVVAVVVSSTGRRHLRIEFHNVTWLGALKSFVQTWYSTSGTQLIQVIVYLKVIQAVTNTLNVQRQPVPVRSRTNYVDQLPILLTQAIHLGINLGLVDRCRRHSYHQAAIPRYRNGWTHLYKRIKDQRTSVFAGSDIDLRRSYWIHGSVGHGLGIKVGQRVAYGLLAKGDRTSEACFEDCSGDFPWTEARNTDLTG